MPINVIELPEAGSRAEQLYAYLRRAIHEGDLRPNERLVEAEIAVLAGVSRTPVREALHKLQVDGLVAVTGRGFVVGTVSADELAELCAVRETLEGMASGLAARSRTEMDLIALRHVADQFRGAAARGDVPDLVRLNHAFHEVIWQAARNRYLARQLHALRGQIERLQPTTLAVPERQRIATAEHDAIVAAIEEQEVDQAERTTRDHFQGAMALRLAMRHLEGPPPPPPPPLRGTSPREGGRVTPSESNL
jgi:DNA-binding GntR family transcriptional regulator